MSKASEWEWMDLELDGVEELKSSKRIIDPLQLRGGGAVSLRRNRAKAKDTLHSISDLIHSLTMTNTPQNRFLV